MEIIKEKTKEYDIMAKLVNKYSKLGLSLVGFDLEEKEMSVLLQTSKDIDMTFSYSEGVIKVVAAEVISHGEWYDLDTDDKMLNPLIADMENIFAEIKINEKELSF